MTNLRKIKNSEGKEIAKKTKKESCVFANKIINACLVQKSAVLDVVNRPGYMACRCVAVWDIITKIKQTGIYAGKRLDSKEQENVIADLIMKELIELTNDKDIKLYQSYCINAISRTNSMVKTVNKALNGAEIEFEEDSGEEKYKSMSRNIARVAEDYEQVLQYLVAFKKVLNDFGKKELGSAVDNVYVYYKNDFIPYFKKLSEDVEKFFKKIHENNNLSVTLHTDILKVPANVIKTYDIEKDRFYY